MHNSRSAYTKSFLTLGNKTFISAARQVARGIFVGCKESSDSDKGDRIESLFNISFWAKEGAIDWKWLGFDTSEKERSADALALAMEWECFRVSDRDLIDCMLDSPWPCAIAVLRTPKKQKQPKKKGGLGPSEEALWATSLDP